MFCEYPEHVPYLLITHRLPAKCEWCWIDLTQVIHNGFSWLWGTRKSQYFPSSTMLWRIWHTSCMHPCIWLGLFSLSMLSPPRFFSTSLQQCFRDLVACCMINFSLITTFSNMSISMQAFLIRQFRSIFQISVLALYSLCKSLLFDVQIWRHWSIHNLDLPIIQLINLQVL